MDGMFHYVKPGMNFTEDPSSHSFLNLLEPKIKNKNKFSP